MADDTVCLNVSLPWTFGIGLRAKIKAKRRRFLWKSEFMCHPSLFAADIDYPNRVEYTNSASSSPLTELSSLPDIDEPEASLPPLGLFGMEEVQAALVNHQYLNGRFVLRLLILLIIVLMQSSRLSIVGI